MKSSTDFEDDVGSTTSGEEEIWECPACTFVNENPVHLACFVCGTPKLTNQASSNDIEKQSMKPELIEENDGPPHDENISASDMEIYAASNKKKTQPKIIDTDDEFPESVEHDEEASASKHPPTQEQRPLATLARSISDSDIRVHQPSQSTSRRQSDPSIAYFPGLEVRLVEDEPSLPFVDAIPFQTNNNDEENNNSNATQPAQSWWKEHQRLITVILLVITTAMVVIMGVSLSSKINNASSEERGSKTSSPHKEPTFSQDETTQATKQPTQQSGTLPSLPFPANSDLFNTNQNVSQSETVGTEKYASSTISPHKGVHIKKSSQSTSQPTPQSGKSPSVPSLTNNNNILFNTSENVSQTEIFHAEESSTATNRPSIEVSTLSPVKPNEPTISPVLQSDQTTKVPTGQPTTTASTFRPADLPTKKPSKWSTKQPMISTISMPTKSYNVNPEPFAWTQQGQAITGDGAGDEAGRSVAISSDGKTLAIGAPGDLADDRRGYVKVYHKETHESIWKQLGQDFNGDQDGDNLGWSLSLSDNGRILAIGAIGFWQKDDRPGYVRVYYREGDDNSWKQLGRDIIGQAAGDQFGYSVSISADGKTLAVGANSNDYNGVSSGQVRVFQIDHIGTGVSWKQLGQDINGEASYDNSGVSVALSGDGKTLAIGASGNDGNGSDAGHVRAYKISDSNYPIWGQIGQDIDGQASDDWFGESVALSSDGKTLAIGAPGPLQNNDRPGYVRVYHRDGNGSSSTHSFQQVGDDIVGEALHDQFGISVALSQDGKIVAIGANNNDGNGDWSGHVRVFHMDSSGSQWAQLGQDINGEKAWDEAGWRVSLSANGKTLAIGSVSNSDNGNDSGHVRVFNIDE